MSCQCLPGCGHPCRERHPMAEKCQACGCAHWSAARLAERVRGEQQHAQRQHVRRAVTR